MKMAGITHRLSLLQPIPIDPTKCTKERSLYHHILSNHQAVSKRQKKQFNLGNSQTFTDPIQAAQYLLQREYGDTSLFNGDLHEGVFIPPTFVSNQYTKKSSVAILDYDVKKDIERLLLNLKEYIPNHWLCKELDAFLQSQKETIGQDALQKWIFNIKIMYLASAEMKKNRMTLPLTTSDFVDFVQGCIKELSSKLPASPLIAFLKELVTSKSPRKLLLAQIKGYPTLDSNLKWLFELELAELGEKIEHWFYDQLVPLKDDILQDTVVLSSVIFMTNLQNKMHRESDFLIISWSRKLIVSVEIKQKITHANTFDKTLEQLYHNHTLFEERLGDQLDHGWTFYPVVCVKNEILLLNSRHYITMETEIKQWLSSIFHQFPIANLTPQKTTIPLEDVKKLLTIIVFSVHVSKKDQIAPITSTNWVEYTSNAIDNVSTSDNIIFYSSQQLAVMNGDDPRYRKLIIRGGWGTGKSILLQQKAIHLSNQPGFKGRVAYLLHMFSDAIPTILYHRLKIDLEKSHGIFVTSLVTEMRKNKKRLLDDVLQEIITRGVKALFIDEIEMDKCSDRIKKIMKVVDFVWIAPTTGSSYADDFKGWEKDFSFLDLSKNFRNSREIAKMTKLVAKRSDFEYKEGIAMPSNNFPSGCTPIYVDSIEVAIKEAQKKTKDGILVIYPITKFPDRNIIMNEKWKIYSLFENNFKEDVLSPYQFLLDGNILITDELLCIGFEWKTVIAYAGMHLHSPTIHHCNSMMRCTSNLIMLRGPPFKSDLFNYGKL